MPTYKDKMEDSFRTKLKIFLFTKSFNDNVKTYINSSENINEEFKKFHLTKEVADVYSSQYYQFEESADIRLENMVKKSKEITSNLLDVHRFILSNSNLKKYLGDKYSELFDEYLENPPMSKKEFNELINKKICAYCGINEELIWEGLGSKGKLHNKRSETRGYKLEIDRKMPNLEYTNDNCCMSCYWCNNAKTDEFLPNEFKEIARGINSVWNKRLNQGNGKIIVFPENSKIWES